MSLKPRELLPENVLYLWEAIKLQKVNGSKVFKCLVNELGYKQDEAKDALIKAVKDGILMANPISTNNNGTAKAGKKEYESKMYRIPDIKEIKINDTSHDWYCFECHVPGELQNCTKCLRSFHLTCKRINPEKPNNSKIPVNQNHIESIFDDQSFNTTSSAVIENNESNSAPELGREENVNNNQEDNDNVPITEEVEDENQNQKTDPLLSDEKPRIEDIEDNVTSSNISSISALKNEKEIENDMKPLETKADVICIGQVRPPSSRRRRASVCYKSEMDDSDEDDSSTLCTKCRLLKLSTVRDPPNMSADEINYLLRFTFDRIKSWINNDTFSPIPSSYSLPIPPKKEFEIISKLCFKNFMNYEIIDDKIKRKDYSTLTEFHCDMLDLQHCMGILYGTNSAEFEATEYLLNDCTFELSEIRQCRDCYRHSNEKSSPMWFCKPCVLRHELVFAKQMGYSFWPAKVIKVKDNQYDVRFFGTNHSRAIVDSSNVKPIDTDESILKIKKRISYIRAMEELQKHQELLQYPPGKFSYEEERKNPIDIEMLISGGMPNRLEIQRQRRSSTKSPKITGAIKRASSRTPQNVLKASSSSSLTSRQTPTTDSPIFSIEVGTMQNDYVTTPGKRKRKIHNYAILENFGSIEKTENTNSDSISNKKMKLTRGTTSNKNKKEKRTPKRKSTGGGKAISSILTTNRKTNFSEQLDLRRNDQDSAISSTQEIANTSRSSKTNSKLRSDKSKSYSEVVENMRKEIEGIKEPAVIQKIAMDTFQTEIDRMQKKMNQLINEHSKAISKIKKRQWCHFCEKEAIYYCCWNTAYCSTICQQKHWHAEHKRACRRTR